ncbi:hypothetical protein B0T17DRAFT_616975 [Bombardia bombarda]|uniref:Uncharacterized protein n=1 Tax=Bombardia bombarda TaxID=252184 RepID=A0AA39X026_9PEZI|nr:hypothetical protein B0T17DRAFT_616975 [Bombardia bombarda]
MTPPNPFASEPRFEIRKLEPQHIPWANAIITHTNRYQSPAWAVLYHDRNAQTLYNFYHSTEVIVGHCINSGYSYGLFDTQYAFKNPAASAPTNGALLWDFSSPDATREELEDQMDFPLVAIALAHDLFHTFDKDAMTPLFQELPLLGRMFTILDGLDTRDPASWKPTAPGQVAQRNGTNTVRGYEGKGLAKRMAIWHMRLMAELGFRGIQIETANPAIDKLWLNPPEPFRAELDGDL